MTFSGETLQVRYGRRGAVNLKHDGKCSFVSSDGLSELQFGLDASSAPQLRAPDPACQADLKT